MPDHALTLTLRLSEAQLRRLVADACRRNVTARRWLQEQIECAVARCALTTREHETAAWQGIHRDSQLKAGFWQGIAVVRTEAETARIRICRRDPAHRDVLTSGFCRDCYLAGHHAQEKRAVPASG